MAMRAFLVGSATAAATKRACACSRSARSALAAWVKHARKRVSWSWALKASRDFESTGTMIDRDTHRRLRRWSSGFFAVVTAATVLLSSESARCQAQQQTWRERYEAARQRLLEDKDVEAAR